MISKSRTRSAQVPPEAAGQRLDLWVKAQDEQLSRSRIQKLIEDERVTVDGSPQPSRYRLRGGESVDWTVPASEPSELIPDPLVEFEIVHLDEDLAVVDKPAGLVVHPAVGHATGTLLHGLLARLDGLSSVGGVERPGLVHRLDKDTSGLLVVACNDAAHQQLQNQLKDRSLHREYAALCWGHPDPAAGEIDEPVDRHPNDRKRRAVVPGGRPATTLYEVESRFPGASLLRLRLQTGRTHQIRVHLAHLGHPVLGDPLYGGRTVRLKGAAPEHRLRLKAALKAIGRQALHAAELGFIHPRSGEFMSFSSPLPADMRAAISVLDGSSDG